MNNRVLDIEVIEDLTSVSRLDEGFLRLKRLRCRNRRADGSTSAEYNVDVVDRPSLDAVAVLLYRRTSEGHVEALLRSVLRPAAYFRKWQAAAVDDGRSWLFVDEIVAGVLEADDKGEQGVLSRAAIEAREEAGFALSPSQVRMLGGPFFVAPGIVSEQIYLTMADVTGMSQQEPTGDGSPLEEGAQLTWRSVHELLDACRRGVVRDAKTELAVTRFLSLPSSSR